MDDERAVHIAFACDGGYVSQFVVAAHSLLEHADAERLYCLSLLTPADLDLEGDPRIDSLLQRHANCVFNQVPIEQEQILRFAKTARQGSYGMGAYFRMILPSILPDVEKCLYLDGDIIVRGDLASFYDYGFEGCSAVAVRDPICGLEGFFKKKHQKNIGIDYGNEYFCAGVMLLDLSKLRTTHVFEHAVEHDLGSFPFADQDALNIELRGDVRFAPLSYNVLAREWRSGLTQACGVYSDAEIESVAQGSAHVIHYAGLGDKPWHSPQADYAQIWWDEARDILPVANVEALMQASRERWEIGSISHIVKRAATSSRVFIHGFTIQGRYLADRLKGCGVEGIAGFVDSNVEKVGGSHNGIACFELSSVLESLEADDLIVIAAQASYAGVRKEYLSAGVDDKALVGYLYKGEYYYRSLIPEWYPAELDSIRNDLALCIDDDVAALAQLDNREFAAHLADERNRQTAEMLFASFWILRDDSIDQNKAWPFDRGKTHGHRE